MEPFEKHPADIGGLNAAGSGLLRGAAEAIDNSGLTQRQYQPAIDSWHGMGAPELQAAPAPLLSRAGDARVALVWAAVVSKYWATQVETFNGEVDRILARFNGLGPTYGLTGDPTDDQVAQARTAALHQARTEWWRAYNTYILDGEDTAISMLRDGPNEASLMRLEGIEGILEWLYSHKVDVAYVIVALLSGLASGAAYERLVRYLLRSERARQAGRSVGRSLGGALRNIRRYQRWMRIAQWAGRSSPFVAAGLGGLNQWQYDAGRRYDYWERGGRAAVTAVAAGVGSWIGGRAGESLGSKAGAVVSGPDPYSKAAGMAVGGIIGAAVGGGFGGWVGERAAIRVNNHTGIGERIGGAVRDAPRNINEIGEGIKRNLPTPSNPIPPWYPGPPLRWPSPQPTR